MHPISRPVFALLALLGTCGCTSSGINDRIQEKSTVFGELAPAVQKNIREGTIEPGYTSDMVYMALGKPSKVKVKDTPHGKVGIWIYANFFPEGYETSPAAAPKSSTIAAEEAETPAASAGKKGSNVKVDESAAGQIKRAPAAGAVADDTENPGVPATSSFVSVGSNYGNVKSAESGSSYTSTDRRDFKPYQANSSTFSNRSAAMEALDVPELDSASLYVIFYEGRVVQMKLGRN